MSSSVSALLLTTSCWAAVTVSVTPSFQTTTVGSQVSFDVVAFGLGNGTAIGAYDIDIVVDPMLLSYTGTTFGTQLDPSGLGDVQSVMPENGSVEVFELSLDTAAMLAASEPASFRLATVSFIAVAAGQASPITLSANAIADASGNPVTATLQGGSISINAAPATSPVINPGGIVPIDSSVGIIQAGSWISIYGTNLAAATASWNGDFPTSLGGTSVSIDSKPAYLWFVSPTQINVQAPDDNAIGSVVVTVTTAAGSSSSTVTLGEYGPSFSLLNSKYPAALVFTPGTAGNSGGGFDYIGPPGAFAFPTRPVNPGEIVVLYGVGFGPTNPIVPAGQAFSGAAPSVTLPQVTIGGVSATVNFAGIVEAGVFQLNVVVPEVSSGDQPLQATVGGLSTETNVFITVQ